MPPPLRALRASIPSLALFLLLTLPFAGRAHHIDDPLYVAAARQAWTAPLDPLGGDSFWHDQPTTLFHDLYNPPLTAYLLAVPVALGGGAERPIHLVMILLGAATLVAATWAGEPLGVPPRWTLLLAASPALCAASVGAMADVPFLLLTLLAWGAALRGRAAWSGVLAGLGALTKYAGILNVPLSVLPLARNGRRKPLLSAAIALFLFLGWCAWTWSAYGQPHVASAGRFQVFGLRRQAEFFLSFVAALGLAGLPAALGLLRWTGRTALLAAAAGAGGAALVHARGVSPGNAALAAAAFGSGAALLAAAWRASRREAPRGLFVPACFWSYATYSILLVYFGATRYLLPLLPPLVWLLARSGELERGTLRFVSSVAGAAALSLLVLWGDAGYANAWRTMADRLPQQGFTMADRPQEGRRFQTGHWGFQWYAGLRGYTPLSARDVLDRGDVVASADGIHAEGPWPAQAAVLEPLETISVTSPWLRVMDRRAQAGLYSSAWGLLSFGFRTPAAETVRLSTPEVWVLAAAAEPPTSPVSVDLGSAEARHVLLDGWSGDEGFEDAGRRTSFVWATGPESALRLPLPRGVQHVRLRLAPGTAAEGPFRLKVGESASGTVDVQPGWRTYDVPLHGSVAGGPTTVVLQPAGYLRPRPFRRETRDLSVAVDGIVFGAQELEENRGVWPVATDRRPGLFVAGGAARLFEGRMAVVSGRVRVVAGSAELAWSETGGAAWSAAAGTCVDGCYFGLAPAETPARLFLRADRAIVSSLIAVRER
jgi:hypothetical protein